MSPIDRRRRRRRGLTRAVVLVVVGVAVLVVALVAVVGGALRAGSQSSSYQRAIDRSYAAQVRVLVGQSDTLDEQFRGVLGSMAADDRPELEAALDTLVRTSANLASSAATAASPAPAAGAGGEITTAMAERAQAMRDFRATIDRLLGMAPLPVAGSSGTTPAVPPTPPALSAAGAASEMTNVGTLLEAADRSYAAGRRALRGAPGRAALPASVWSGRTAAWTPGAMLRVVDSVVGSANLAPLHRVELVDHALVLAPAPVPPASAGTTAAAVLPPTGLVTVTAVVANDGNVGERGVVVRASLQPVAGAPTTATTATSGGMVRSVSLAAHDSQSVTLPPMRVVPGNSYQIVVSVQPPLPNAAGTAVTDTLSIRVAPPGPATVGQLLPAKGSTRGETHVTILGSGFTWVSAVTFGTADADFRVVSSTEITAVSPPGTGKVTVHVVNPGGSSSAVPADRYTYRRK